MTARERHIWIGGTFLAVVAGLLAGAVAFVMGG